MHAAAVGSVESMKLLLEHGINHIDVAAAYGDAELRISNWLSEHEFFVAPLDLPDVAHAASAEELRAAPAVELFGESAWALRLPALLMGMASLVLVWWLARKEIGRGAALLTLALLALSYHHVWFTQNARGYTGLLTWTTAATILLMSGLRRPRWRVWTLYGLCLAAGMYTHLSAGFFFVAHGAVFAALLGMALLRPQGPIARTYPGARNIQSFYGFALGGALLLLLHLPLLDQIRSSVGEVSSGSSAPATRWPGSASP